MVNSTPIINFSMDQLSQGNMVTTLNCREWCKGQHFTHDYGSFITLLFFNIVMSAIFLFLYGGSDKLIHNISYLTEERVGIILHSIVKFTFLVNAGYGIYFMFTQ